VLAAATEQGGRQACPRPEACSSRQRQRGGLAQQRRRVGGLL